ncbi:YuzD family protein [Bacillus sp. 1NLA3E]|uniref:YuzD family protein n=1 Tax=Bacillus sp. 1NLA3E TaxID=666686 RepID=UPI000247F390|nr:YuzD family protein [Bacillus sp. 1NLA3E]AGK55473.1 YuzD-like protein [Bacillus sp. 1NLA3E]
MEDTIVEIVVYGTEQVCPSCVSLPSSKETYEWLEAAISRKYPNQQFFLTYVDIFEPPNDAIKQKFARKIIDENLFYPVVVIDGNVVAEGSPRLKNIFAEMEKRGYKGL